MKNTVSILVLLTVSSAFLDFEGPYWPCGATPGCCCAAGASLLFALIFIYYFIQIIILKDNIIIYI